MRSMPAHMRQGIHSMWVVGIPCSCCFYYSCFQSIFSFKFSLSIVFYIISLDFIACIHLTDHIQISIFIVIWSPSSKLIFSFSLHALYLTLPLILINRLETLFSNIIFPDEESTTSGEIYSSSHRLIPGTRSHQHENSDYGRAASANPSSLGHESGFQSSASLRSLSPSLLNGSLYEHPIKGNVGGNVSLHLGNS